MHSFQIPFLTGVCLFVCFLVKIRNVFVGQKKKQLEGNPQLVIFCFHSYTLIKLPAITRLWMKKLETVRCHINSQLAENIWAAWVHLIPLGTPTPRRFCSPFTGLCYALGICTSEVNGKELLQPLSDSMAQTRKLQSKKISFLFPWTTACVVRVRQV